MNWFRMDSGVSRHPKLLELTPAERWCWLDMICWASEYSEAEGHMPKSADRACPGLRRLRPRLRELELLDDGDVIHDWFLYTAASVEDKVDWYLRRYPDASASEVARQVHGNKQVVLNAVRENRARNHRNGSGSGSAEPGVPVPEAVPANMRYVTEPVSQNHHLHQPGLEAPEPPGAQNEVKVEFPTLRSM